VCERGSAVQSTFGSGEEREKEEEGRKGMYI